MSNQSTKFFYSLTPEVVLDAVEATGVRCTGRLLALNSMENRVYQVEIEAGEEASLYERYRVVKFYRPGRWSEQQISEEHRFLQDLDARDIPVAQPLAFPDGARLRILEELGIFYAVFPRIGGRTLDELHDEQLEILGRFLARLHQVGMEREAASRLTISVDTFGRENLRFLLEHSIIPEKFRASFESVAERLFRIAEPWFAETPTHRLHGDCHVGNILWLDTQCCFVDFDDMANGPAVQDLWLLVPGRDEESLRQRERLLRGYQQLRDFDQTSLRLIEPLRALRMIHFCAWIGKRWEDPAFPITFPSFGTDEFWAGQISAVNECLEIMCVGSY